MIEPLEIKKKASEESFRTTVRPDDVEESAALVPVVAEAAPRSQPGHARKLTPADLNKPLPPVLMTVPFKIKVDRTFSWDKLGSVRGSLASSRVQSGMGRLSGRSSTSRAVSVEGY